LEPVYKNKVWVIIDEGFDEKRIIESLKNSYLKNGWNDENFSQFSEHDFERYYPKRFEEKVNFILAETNKQRKREAKKALLDEIKQWICTDEKIARLEFKISAQPVIDKLKIIAKRLD
jgi:hypothetical protein